MKKINSKFYIGLIIFLIICFSAFLTFFMRNGSNIPIHVFAIEDKDMEYKINYDKTSGNYFIAPTNSLQYHDESYISYAPEQLDKFIGRKVKITGQFVLTKTILHHDDYVGSGEWNPPITAVKILSIQLVN